MAKSLNEPESMSILYFPELYKSGIIPLLCTTFEMLSSCDYIEETISTT